MIFTCISDLLLDLDSKHFTVDKPFVGVEQFSLRKCLL